MEMASDMKEQLIEKLKSVQGFSIQTHKLMDMTNDGQLLGFVQYKGSDAVCGIYFLQTTDRVN